jgi:hypothetical protein
LEPPNSNIVLPTLPPSPRERQMGQPLSTPGTHTVATSFAALPLARGRGGLAQAGQCKGCGQVAVWCACVGGDGGGNGRSAPSTAAPDPASRSCSPVPSGTMVEMREFVDGSRWQMSDRSPFVRSPTLGPAVSPLPALESRAQQLRGDATEAGGVQQQQQQLSIYLATPPPHVLAMAARTQWRCLVNTVSVHRSTLFAAVASCCAAHSAVLMRRRARHLSATAPQPCLNNAPRTEK